MTPELDNPKPPEPFGITPRPLGLPPELSYDSIEELIEALEGADHR